MSEFETLNLTDVPDETAPDGSRVRPLLRTGSASMAHFELAAGACSRAVAHRNVEEIWFVLSGRGRLWRARDGIDNITELEPGCCFTIPRETHFQLRADDTAPLSAVALTMPPWPGSDAAYEVSGIWSPTL